MYVYVFTLQLFAAEKCSFFSYSLAVSFTLNFMYSGYFAYVQILVLRRY